MANKSAFIRSLPHSMAASEVVKKGAAAGMKFTDKYVWSIRAKAGGAPRKPGRPKGSKNKPKANSRGGDAQQAFAELALELGLSRAEAILSRLRAAVRSAAIG